MEDEDAPTRTSDGAARVGAAAAAPGGSRFAPGTVLAGRYRIVSLLARGGIGEVYRADDLKLSQAVALKFLPEALAQDASRLARFLNEVRVARQVTHPGVCRVHDVGELGGQHFLSMAGTPAYMAPEQFGGVGVSPRSDIYALGLVLYEIFTGRPAFRADTLSELVRLQREAVPAPPSAHSSGLDPTLDQVILQCLEKDPTRRPESAIAVAAALPGSDALGALLAAGETTTPELVAAAGPRETLAPALGRGPRSRSS